jgi:protocatechuate 3,4-dioxygenase, beta subunit
MYLPGDPLQPLDPVLNSVPGEQGRQRLVAEFDIARTEPDWALAYSWDIVLRGREATPFETGEEGR